MSLPMEFLVDDRLLEEIFPSAANWKVRAISSPWSDTRTYSPSPRPQREPPSKQNRLSTTPYLLKNYQIFYERKKHIKAMLIQTTTINKFTSQSKKYVTINQFLTAKTIAFFFFLFFFNSLRVEWNTIKLRTCKTARNMYNHLTVSDTKSSIKISSIKCVQQF